MRFMSIYAGIRKGAIAVIMLFSALVCSAFATESTGNANEIPLTELPAASSLYANAIQREIQAREIAAYTITGDGNRTVTPGTYTRIIVNAPVSQATKPDIIIGPGEVTLTGTDGNMFEVGTGTSNKLQLETTGQAAILRLLPGTATGTIGIGLLRSTARNGDNMLYIGDNSGNNPTDSTTLPTVAITGNINGLGRSYIERYDKESLLETQGANLVVKGNISDNESSAMLRTLNAYNGSIETDSGGNAETRPKYYDLYAYNVNLKSGNHISAAVDFFASSVNLPADSYIYAGNRLDVAETIGDKGGSMALGSTLESGKMVVLRGGVAKGAGLIKSDTRSILSHVTTGEKDVETALFPIKQGGDDPLRLESGQDILPGDADVDTMRAGRDIVAGTLTFRQGDAKDPYGALPGRYLLNAGGEGFTYPRATITANTIDATGRLLAGELNMPRASEKDREASLKAGNIWITSSAPAENGFARASGNFTFDNGSFTLTSPDNLAVQKGTDNTHLTDVTLDYASIIDGNMTVTRNKDSSFTTLNVGETARISEGSLNGSLLKANAAVFDKVLKTTISDTLDVATNLDITANGEASVTHTKVGNTANIAGGAYSGTDFSASSAYFRDMNALSLAGDLPEGVAANLNVSKDLTITGGVNAKVDHTKVGEAAQISGGAYSGADFTADNATFEDVSKINFSDSLTLETSLKMTNSVANDIKSATVKNGDATVIGGSYSGGSLKARNATFTDVSGLTLTATLDLSGSLKLGSTGLNSITTASIGGDATISGGSYSGGTLSAANANFSGVDSVSLDGDFNASGNATFENVGSAKLADMSVGANLAVESSYLTAKDARALAAKFTNNTSAEFDDLTLTGDDLSLVIEDGSTVFINNGLTDLKGIEAVQDGKLIIHGYNDTPTTIAEMNIDEGTTLANENGIVHVTNSLYGGNNTGAPTSAKFTQLAAGEIEVTNVDLTLAGIGNFANKVDRNLIIHQNGNSRLGDITVGGLVKIDGGTLGAGQMKVTGDASFEDVALTLSGSGDNASSVGGDLIIANGGKMSSIGDINVTGNTNITGGVLEALELKTASATLANSIRANIHSLALTSGSGSLNIGAQGEEASNVNVNTLDLKGAPLTVHGESALQIYDSANLGDSAINIPDGGIISGYGDLEVASLALGQDATFAAANVTVASQLTEMRGGAITATDGNVTLAGGAKDAKGSITANDDIIAGGEDSYADINGESLSLDAGKNIAAGTVAVNSISAGANINATDITAKTLTAGGNVTASAGSVNLTGEGSAIGGALTISANKDSSVGDLDIGGALSAHGGKFAAGSLGAGSAALDGAITANISSLSLKGTGSFFNIGKEGEEASSLAVNRLGLNGAPLNVYGASVLEVKSGEDSDSGILTASAINIFQNGKIRADGAITADSARLGQDGAELAGANVTITDILADMKGGAITANAGDVTLLGGTLAAAGAISASKDLVSGRAGNYQDLDGELELAAGANIRARTITVNSLKAGGKVDAIDITAKTLTAGGNVTASAGSVNLTGEGSSVGGDLTVPGNIKSSLGKIEVSGKTSFASGELEASSLTTGSASFDNIKAAFDELVLKDPGDGHELALTSSGANVSQATVKTLNLNGATLNLAANSASPANLYVNRFSGSSDLVNGNIAVNKNGMLVLGAQNAALLQTPNAIATNGHAAFALAQPMRLDSRYGIHVTGSGIAAPVANTIRFDASSLFVIDSSLPRVVYSYAGSGSIVPSAQLSEKKGAIGALSADKPSASAYVNMGAQIYIRNPKVNTVIVALGENITTLYEDKTARSGDSSAAPWTDQNLDYDNKDKVKIKRLENGYAGQFLVLPADTPDDPAPSQPDTPATPANPTPTQPATPANPTPTQPDTPATPAKPNPSQPDTPDDSGTDKPQQPDTPAKPNTPGDPATPSSPSIPAKPNPAASHPNAHPGINNVIQNGIDKGHIGTEPHHLATHHGAGFISHTLAHGNPQEATHLLESSSRMIILGAVPQMAISANDAAQTAISGRLGPDNMAWQGDEIRARSFALWAVPLYRAMNAWELKAGNHDYDYRSGLGGIALGADVTWEDIVRAGVAFNMGGGYSKSGGHLNDTENNMSFWGLGAYAGLVYGNLGISADVNFTSTYNKVKQDVSALNNWGDLKTDATARVWSAALDLEYRLDAGWLELVPHAGFKYNFIQVDDYDITHRGDTIIKGKEFNQNIWTFPLGVKLAKEFNFENGWQLKPALDFRVTPAAGDIEARTTTRYTGTDLDIDLRTQTMDYITYGGSASLEARMGDFTLGVSYSLNAGSNSLSNAVFGTFRYEF